MDKSKKDKENIDVRDFSSLNNDLKKTVIDTIEFNALKGSYIISYHELGNSKTEEYHIGKNELHIIKKQIKRKMSKWKAKSKELNKIDMNLNYILTKFDNNHHSNCLKEYLHDTNNYTTNYYMSKIFKNKEYSFKEKMGLLITANRQKRHKKANVENPKGLYSIPVIASLALVFGLTGINISSSNKNKGLNDYNNKIVNDVKNKDDVFDSVLDNLIKGENKIEVLSDIGDVVIINEQKEEVILEENDKEIIEENDKEIIEDSEKENNIYDSFYLDNIDLEYSPIENIKHVNTDSLEYVKEYKIALISAYEGDKVLCNEKITNFENESISKLISNLNDEYGENIEVYANWNAFDQNGNQVLTNVGWSNLENLKTENISYSDDTRSIDNKNLDSEISNTKQNAKVYIKK